MQNGALSPTELQTLSSHMSGDGTSATSSPITVTPQANQPLSNDQLKALSSGMKVSSPSASTNDSWSAFDNATGDRYNPNPTTRATPSINAKDFPGISGYMNAGSTGGLNFLKSYLSDIGNSIHQVGSDVMEQINGKGQTNTAGQEIEDITKGGKDVLNAVTSPITGVVSPVLTPIIKGLSDEALKSPTVVKGLNAVNDLIYSHPELASTAGNIFQTFLNAFGLAGGGESATEAGATPKVETVGPTTPVDTTNLPERLGGEVQQTTQNAQPAQPAQPVIDADNQKTINNRLKTLGEIERNSNPIARISADANSKGIDIKNILANTDLLQGSVDSTGRIDTLSKGNAVDQFKQILNKYDSAVSDGLKREGVSIPFSDVETALNQSVSTSRVAGSAKTRLANQVQDELSGLKSDVDENGNIPLTKLQDAKISTTNGVDYTKPETKVNSKTIASVYRNLIEDNSSLPIKPINAELSKYYRIQDYLETLNGKVVRGGKLGTYFAKTLGAVAGGHLPLGPLGPLVGSEIASLIKGTALENTFGPLINKDFESSDLIKNVSEQNKQPPLGLPQPKEGTPNAQGFVPIPLREASSVEAPAQVIRQHDTQPVNDVPRLNSSNPIQLPQSNVTRTPVSSDTFERPAFDFSRVARSLDNKDRTTILDFFVGRDNGKAKDLAVQIGLPHAFGTHQALMNDFIQVLHEDRKILKGNNNQ